MAESKSSITSGAASGSRFFSDSFISWLRSFYPAPMKVDAKERWRAVVGACIGIGFTAIICSWIAHVYGVAPWLVAPLGASAVLVFAVPASPLAQPWSVIGGNTVSALVGIACVQWIPDATWAAAMAVALAIGAMFILRCLHPPGGAMALLTVLTGASHFSFAFFPALLNSVMLVLAGIIYNSATRRRYPHVQIVERAVPAKSLNRFSSADLDAVLSRYNQVLDVSRDDLESILQLTEMQAYRRKLGEIRCGDIMSNNPITVEYATTLEEAWALMRKHRVKALPVVDRHQHLLGIMTIADFMRHAQLDSHSGVAEKLRSLIRYTTTLHSSKPDVVGQIMTSQVRVASADKHVVELLPLFSEGGHHHIPIVSSEHKLVGMITQSDFVRALYKAD
ncbi:MAG TPA: HPP family protein [Steroidobacteraceae bacterium]|jgi:CBS domain-containing membrane protein|nr:HPP family protein [Steroidobacteraceae bacterium]